MTGTQITFFFLQKAIWKNYTTIAINSAVENIYWLFCPEFISWTQERGYVPGVQNPHREDAVSHLSLIQSFFQKFSDGFHRVHEHVLQLKQDALELEHHPGSKVCLGCRSL